MVLREKQEKTEDLILGPFAAKSSETKGAAERRGKVRYTYRFSKGQGSYNPLQGIQENEA